MLLFFCFVTVTRCNTLLRSLRHARPSRASQSCMQLACWLTRRQVSRCRGECGWLLLDWLLPRQLCVGVSRSSHRRLLVDIFPSSIILESLFPEVTECFRLRYRTLGREKREDSASRKVFTESVPLSRKRPQWSCTFEECYIL